MSSQPAANRPPTVSPRLNFAIGQGWEAWEAAVAKTGAETTGAWLAERAHEPELKGELIDAVREFLDATDPDDRNLARVELAELLEGHDDVVADTLWEAVLAYGRTVADAETIFEAISQLAAIAEHHGEPQAAAEFWIEYLNWRRQDSHVSDPDQVQNAFDEIIRLARLDGEQTVAAQYEYRQAQFTRLDEADDERAAEGDWEATPAPYLAWE